MIKISCRIILILSGLAWCQIDNPVSISVETDSTARAGEVVQVRVKATMDEEWKIYSIYRISDGPLPTEISVGGTAVGVVASVIEPEPVHTFDPGFEADTYYHSGNIQFLVPVRLKRDLDPGNYDIVADIFYQVCNARLCYPPVTKSDTVQITIEPGTPRSDRMSFTVATVTSSDKKPSTLSGVHSFLSLLLLAIGGAVLSWVMPCVYPMIPIIISFFGKLSDKKILAGLR